MQIDSIVGEKLMYLKAIALFLLSSIFTVANAQQEESNVIDQLAERHQQLIPIVAVADMYFGCQQLSTKSHEYLSHHQLITALNKEQLAMKLQSCLGTHGLQSDTTIKYGMLGCFSYQIRDFSETEQQQHIDKLKQLLATQSRAEIQKSFTQCVNDQALEFL